MNLRSRLDRLALLVLGGALGTRLAAPLGSRFDAVVVLVLVFGCALVLVAPVRPLTARELSHEVERMVRHERRRHAVGDDRDHDSRQRQEPPGG